MKEWICLINYSSVLTHCVIFDLLFCASGWLVDETDDYSAAFYLSGLCLISSAVFVVLVDRLVQRRNAEEADVHQVMSQQEGWETGKAK